MMMPEQRFYFASQTPTHDIALRRRLNEDLYINYAGPGTNNSNVILQENQNFGSTLGQPQAVLQGRLLRISNQIKF